LNEASDNRLTTYTSAWDEPLDVATHDILVMDEREEINNDRRNQLVEAGRSVDKCISNSGSDESSISDRGRQKVLELG